VKHTGGAYISVKVKGNTEEDYQKALKLFKKKVTHSGIMRELKRRKAFESPGEKKRRKIQEAKRREWRLKVRKRFLRAEWKRKRNRSNRNNGKPHKRSVDTTRRNDD
jgi:small subunit ribosomal protein S21